MKVELRPFTNQERIHLKSSLRYQAGGLDDFLAAWLIVGGMVTLAVSYFAILIKLAPNYVIFVTVVSVIVSGILSFRHARNRRRKAGNCSSSIKADLENGQAEICTFEASEAIAVEQFEDEGTGFYLRIDPKQTLFLVGQHLDELFEEKKFPCKIFKLVRGPQSKIPLDLVCIGDYLPPFGTRPPFEEDDFKKDHVPTDGDLLDIDFEDLKKKVAKND